MFCGDLYLNFFFHSHCVLLKSFLRKLSEPGVGVGLGEGGDCDGDEVGAGDDDGPDVTGVGGSLFPEEECCF